MSTILSSAMFKVHTSSNKINFFRVFMKRQYVVACQVNVSGIKMTGALCLEWENLNLQVKERHFDYFKCRTRVEVKKILTDGE